MVGFLVEEIRDRVLYHLTADRPYKRALVAGQKLEVGYEVNPYFGFYEGARQYGVRRADGSMLQFKARAFLTHVRDGKIQTDQYRLADIAAEVATHFVMLVRELVMEEVRKEVCPEAPSRQRCLYVCESLEEARYWNKFLGDQGNIGSICSLLCNGLTHRADTGLLLGDSEPLSVTRERATRYWRGEAGDKPEWETLFVGNAVVTGIGL